MKALFAPALALLLLFPESPWAQSAQEYDIKASFISKFMGFVQWPPQMPAVVGDAPDTFVVSILGPDPFRDNLIKAFQNASVDGKPVKVQSASDVQDLVKSKVVFIAGSERVHVDRLVRWAAENGALTIGDGDGFGEKGVIINFYLRDEKVRFEINAKAAEKSGLQISSLLLKVARIVGE